MRKNRNALGDVEAVRDKLCNLHRNIKDIIDVSVNVTLVRPGTLPPIEGKAQRGYPQTAEVKVNLRFLQQHLD